MKNTQVQKFKNLVWFKKDLRATDHRPLKEAILNGPTLGVFIIEDQWLQSFECSPIHKQFLKDSLLELKSSLKSLNVPLMVCQGSATGVLEHLKSVYQFSHLYSHEETGVYWTYERDLKVKVWCQNASIKWTEYKHFAVLRGLKNRNLWNPQRPKIIERELHSTPTQNLNLKIQQPHFDLKALSENPTNTNLQKGGSSEAIKTLQSFYNDRGKLYYKKLSSPNTAYESCSRLSPYISWGNLSLSQIHHSILKKRNSLKLQTFKDEKNWERSLKAFESRLWWHCHFIQKLESEPEIEFQNVNRAFDGMRENDFSSRLFEAWKKGETGFPLIDASMKALQKHGWINFRMRAMLVSFASYQLWLHWEPTSKFLAKYFIDFEPGIHFSQFQMQSGVTGINSIRIYSPVKQSLDQDPQGHFIKSYCPELSQLDTKDALSPWEAPPMMLQMSGFKLGEHYPHPVVDPQKSYTQAKEKIFAWRQKLSVQEEAKKVYQKHGSRKHKRFPNQSRKVF